MLSHRSTFEYSLCNNEHLLGIQFNEFTPIKTLARAKIDASLHRLSHQLRRTVFITCALHICAFKHFGVNSVWTNCGYLLREREINAANMSIFPFWAKSKPVPKSSGAKRLMKICGHHKFELSNRKPISNSKLNDAPTHSSCKTLENNTNDYYHYYFIVNWTHSH